MTIDPLHEKRILVTGGTGLVGGHLLFKIVQEEGQVLAIKRASSNLSKVKQIFSYYSNDPQQLFEKIQWIEADITSLTSMMEACAGVDEVYHAAAFVSFQPSEKKKMLHNNISGTSHIVDSCLANDVKKLCFVGSVASLGEPVSDEEITEKTLWKSGKGRSAYAVSKFKSEMEVWRGTCEGLNAIIVNPSVILGPGNWKAGSSAIFNNIYKGLKFYPPGKTGFVDVRDVVEAILLLMKSEVNNERFILNAANMYYKDVFQRIAQELGKPAPSIRVTPFLGNLAWRGAGMLSTLTGLKPAITKETVRAGFNEKTYSTDKVHENTGFNFRDINDTIRFVSKKYLSDHA